MVILIVLLIIALLFFSFLAAICRYAVRPDCLSMEKSYNQEKAKGFVGDYNELTKEKYTVRSFDGYELHVEYITSAKPDNRFVIISHGYTYTRYGSLKYMHLYRERGYNCIIYDDRGHGENKRCVCTFGLKESRDLIAVINDTYARFGDDIYLGLHGESMGSGLEITALKYKPKVQFIVNDCGYAEVASVLKGQLKNMHIPACLLKPAAVVGKLLYGYSFYEVRPIDSLKNNRIPICFIHGAADTFIDCVHSKQMHEADAGYSEYHTVADAEHGQSIDTDYDGYRKILNEFLDKVE